MKSAELPIHDLRMALRAVGDCRDVGHDPIAWNFRIACFLKDRFRSVLTTAFTHSIEHNGVSTAQGVLCTLWADNRLHARWLKFIQDHGYRRYLSVQRFAEKGAQTPNTFIRQDLISDREWRTSDERADRLSLKQDELMLSVQPIDGKLSHVFSINRANGDEPFTKRERGLVRLVHEELGVLFGSRLSLTMETETFPTDLSPRLQAVLICLLSGESEKQIASRLGLSPHTVHEYVSKLYRELKVHSRGELMTFAYRRGWVRQDIPVSP